MKEAVNEIISASQLKAKTEAKWLQVVGAAHSQVSVAGLGKERVEEMKGLKEEAKEDRRRREEEVWEMRRRSSDVVF